MHMIALISSGGDYAHKLSRTCRLRLASGHARALSQPELAASPSDMNAHNHWTFVSER